MKKQTLEKSHSISCFVTTHDINIDWICVMCVTNGTI